METNSRKSILVIYTGGTIGMIIDQDTGVLKPFNFDNIYQHIPALKLLDNDIQNYCFDPVIDSSNMNPKFWVDIATVISENYENFDGFVILHGSDTMAYTASALSFMLENLNKPVILTGSQLPLGMIRTDGRENFITSIEIAAATIDDTPIVPEVAIYFENELMRGNRTIKYNAEHFEAFRSPNYPALAEVGVYIKYKHNYIRKPNFKRLKVHKNLETNIAVLKLYPGISENFVRSVLQVDGLKGIILETYGSGNAPTESWFLEALEQAIENGIVILNVTQCQGGSVDMSKYQTGIALKNMGVINGFDITTEAAITKMMYLFGETADPTLVIEKLTKSLRGEITI
nr:type I asparaginase [Bacteroidota bacterium]